jgi:ABC-type antimicrobial peptide transport system permease subunit
VRHAPVTAVGTMQSIVDSQMAGRRDQMLLLSIFSGLALLLAVVGIYGVLSYAVAQRTREIAVRIAIGASGDDVLRMILGNGLRLTCLGVGIGATGAFWLSGLMKGMLFGVTPTDPATFLSGAAVLLAVITAACVAPALRAARLDPLIALREE